MKLLEGKKALIFGVANKRSIGWGIAQQFHQHGAEIGYSYAMEALERRVKPLAAETNSTFVEMCDVTKDEDIDELFVKAKNHFGEIDILVHSIAFAKQEDLQGRFHLSSRDGFALAMDISAYSLIALARGAMPLMPNGGSIMAMSYYGAEKVVPNYNTMAIAKSALESVARYLAADLGPEGIRVNTISAGPIKTLAAAGISGFRSTLGYVAERTPLKRNVDQGEVGKTALYLASDLSSGVTGENIYVDAG
ncbi:MAG: enoyl-ACP reductase, partial [Chloroflexota bacterium]